MQKASGRFRDVMLALHLLAVSFQMLTKVVGDGK